MAEPRQVSFFQAHWQVLVNVCETSKAFKESAKVVGNLFTLAVGASQLGMVSTWSSVVEFPGSLNYFIQGKHLKEEAKILETAQQVFILACGVLSLGRALDVLLSCMGWASKALGVIPVIGATLAATPFGLIINVAAAPISVIGLGMKGIRLYEKTPTNRLEWATTLMDIVIDITKIAAAVLTIISIAAAVKSLAVVGTVIGLTGSVIALTSLYIRTYKEAFAPPQKQALAFEESLEVV